MQGDPFKALADETRRVLLDRLYGSPGQCLGELCGGLGMSRQSVSKHLAILEKANLVASIRKGREKHYYLNPVPLADISERWLKKFSVDKAKALHRLKTALEKYESNTS